MGPLVLWVVPVGDLGGVARHVLDVARVGIPGHRVWFLVPPGPLAEALRELGAAVLTASIGPDAGTSASVREVRRTVQRLRPAIVHSHLAHADVVVAAATVGLPVRLVSTEHGIAGDDMVYHRSAIRQRVMAAVHTARTRRFDALIAVAEATAAAMRIKWHVRDIDVILNGIDRPPKDVVRPRSDGLRVISLARLSPEKRLDRLVDGFALLQARRPDATLTIAGEGPLRDQIAAQVDRLGLATSISLPGYVPAGNLLATADVLAQLSLWENCSYALLDALVAGVGVCATAVGGNPEILPSDCLVDAEDPAAIAALIERQADPDLRPRLRPTWPTVADMTAQIAAVYRRVG